MSNVRLFPEEWETLMRLSLKQDRDIPLTLEEKKELARCRMIFTSDGVSSADLPTKVTFNNGQVKFYPDAQSTCNALNIAWPRTIVERAKRGSVAQNGSLKGIRIEFADLKEWLERVDQDE